MEHNVISYQAIVQKVIAQGPHGPYAVAASEALEGSVTFSLDPTVWQEEDWPEAGSVVLLSKVRQRRAGWRSQSARFVTPSDISNSISKEKRV
jgi:predicted anti-sigma-YlaC factor YlaD